VTTNLGMGRGSQKFLLSSVYLQTTRSDCDPARNYSGREPVMSPSCMADDDFSVSAGMTSDHGRQPVQCKRVDYGVR
jgi:hypothetical protein